MKKTLAIITGATSGIGKSLTELLAAKGITVLAIGRDTEKLALLPELPHGNHIIPIRCDITQKRFIPAISSKLMELSKTHQAKYLVHNATTLHPIKPLADITEEEILKQIAVNLTGPMLLTNSLLSYFEEESRILFISTGASRAAITHLVPHCASKSAQAILAKGYKEELKGKNILVGIVEPGIVNTPSQEYIRSLSTNVLPFSETARETYAKGDLSTSKECALLLYNLLCETNPEIFNDQWPWKLNDPEHLKILESEEEKKTSQFIRANL